MKKVLVVGDLHSGSIDSLMPPTITLGGSGHRGMEVKQNRLQRMLWREWEDMCDKHWDVLIVMGDSVDGTDRHADGMGNWTNDIDTQISCAVKLLKMVGAKSVYGIQGSNYHVGTNGSADAEVVRRLGGKFAQHDVVNIENVKFYIKHATGATSTMTGRGTSINKDMLAMKLYPETYGDIDVHLRGHAHYYHAIIWEGILGVLCPAWKSKDDFMKRGTVTFGNDIGYIAFECDDGEYSWESKTFKIPRSLMFGGE